MFTLEEAKEYFMAMDCSRFHMARENKLKYEKYVDLNISEQTEMRWRREKFNDFYDSAMSSSENNSLWKLVNRMYDLVSSTRDVEDLIKIHSLIELSINKLSPKDRIIIAETIIGRKGISERSGLIFLAYDLKNIILAKGYAKTASKLVDIANSVNDEDLTYRLKKCKQVNHEVIKILNL
ncbi:hypothetical protein AN1V17_40890 [Vallitalea sediminicola]